MKKQKILFVFALAFLLSAGGASAQTNFWWTNNASGVWNDTAVWSNENATVLAPAAGGGADYGIVFQNAGTITATLNSGTPNFLLNQLTFDAGAGAVTIAAGAGTSLTFGVSSGGVLPAFINNSANGGALNLGLALTTNMLFNGTGTGAVSVTNLTGNGSLTMGGSYALTVNGSNINYFGATTITNGTLKIGHARALGTNRTVNVSGAGTLDLNGVDMRTQYVYNVTISGVGVSGNGAVVNNGAQLTNLGVDNMTLAGDATIGGTARWGIQNGVNLAGFTLTKAGSAYVTFNNGTVTAGNIIVNAGTLSLEGATLLVPDIAGSAITLNTGGILQPYATTAANLTRRIVANGGTLLLGAGAGGINSPVTLQSNLTLNVTANWTMGGVISESGGSFAVLKTGTSPVTLSGKSTYTGGTSNTAGALVLGGNDVLGTGPLVMNGGVLSNSVNATLTNAIVLQANSQVKGLGTGGILNLSGPISSLANQTLTLGAGSNAATRGVIVLGGANSFSGNVTVVNGTVVVKNSLALGVGNKSITVNKNTNYDPTLALDGSEGAIELGNNLSFVTSQPGAAYPAITNLAGNNVINGNFTLTGGGGSTLISVGSGTLTLNGNFTPDTYSRTLHLGGLGTGTVNGVLQNGTGINVPSLVKQDNGMWTIATPTTSTGTNEVRGGKLLLTAGNNTFTTNVGIIVTAGTLDLGGSTQQTTNFISLQGGIVQNGTLEQVGVLPFDGRAGIIGANLAGGVALNKGTTGTLVLLGNNQYTGGTVISNGTLGISSLANVGGAGATVTLAGGLLQVLGSGVNVDSLSVNWNSIPYGSGLDIANTGNVQVLASALGGSSYLTKAGPGTLVFTNDNTYSGGTLITGGMLQLGNGGTSGTLGTGHVTNNSGLAASLIFQRSDSQTITNNIAGNGGLYVKNGTITFSNNAVSLGVGANGSWVAANPTETAVLIAAGNSVVTGSASGATSGLLIGKDGKGYLIVKDNAYVAQRLGAGGAANSAGVIYQLGGAVYSLGASSTDAGIGGYYNGGTYGAYGFYGLYNGVFTNASYYQIGGYGVGVQYNLGGVMVQNGQPLEISRHGTGVVYFAGNSVYTSGQNIQVGGASGSANGMAIMTVADNAAVAAGQLVLGQSGQKMAILNLDGGALQVSQINKANAATYGLVNFDGGTLRATTSGNLFNTGANAPSLALVYSGGAFLDSSNNNVIVAQTLLAPDGNGVTSIAVPGGAISGYMGSPYVDIRGGGGTGATAIAQFDYTTGSVTGIVITSHGYGYTTAPSVVLTYGGSTNVYIGQAAIGANASGALTKLGTGTMQLSGTNNTYTGGTFINAGMLAFATTNAMGTGQVTINDGGTLAMTGAYANAAAWLTSGKLSTNSAGGLALALPEAGTSLDFTTVAGGTYSNLYVGALQNMLYTGTLTFRNNDWKLGGGSAAFVLTNNLAVNSLTLGGASPSGLVALAGANTITTGTTLNENGGLSIANPGNLGGGTLTINGGTIQIRDTAMTDFTGLTSVSTTIPGDFALDIASRGNTFSVPANLTLGGMLTKQGVGTLVLGGSNNIAGLVTVGSGALRLTHSDALDGAGSSVTVASGAALELQGGITTEATDALLLYGFGNNAAVPVGTNNVPRTGALRNISGDNTWSGPIVLGGQSRINSDSGLLTLAGPVTNNNGGVISMLGGAGNILIPGQIVGSGAWGKDGAGMVTLTGSNIYTGGTYVYGGTLQLDFGAGGAP